MQTVKKIGLGSAFRVGAVLGGLIFAIVGLPVVLIVTSSMLGQLLETQTGGSFSGGIGLVAGLVIYIIGIFLYAIISGIGFLIDALIYNIVASIVGGIEIELE
jgi:hypothetical protein